MVKNNKKIKGVAVTFEHLIYLNAEDYDISSLDSDTIKELALEKWNKEMSEEDKELTHGDIVEIEVEIPENEKDTTFIQLYDLLAELED